MDIKIHNIDFSIQGVEITEVGVRYDYVAPSLNVNGYVAFSPAEYFPASSDLNTLKSVVKAKLSEAFKPAK